MEGLNMDNILTSEEIENLFSEDSHEDSSEETSTQETKEDSKDDVVDENSLFSDTETEEQDTNEQENTHVNVSTESSPKSNNFYSSIAQALKEDGVFSALPEDFNISSAEDFTKAIQEEVNSRLDEHQKRISEALTLGIEPSEIVKSENLINYLNSIKEEYLEREGEESENIRKQLIYQDFLNRGYTPEKAEKEVNKSINSGSDIEDAKDALKANKDFYTNSYNNLLEEARKEQEEALKNSEALAEGIKNTIMSSKDILGGIDFDRKTREKALLALSRKSFKDPDTGEMLTELQKYQKENYKDFLANLALVFSITDGFKDINNLVNQKVKKQMKSSISKLEQVIDSTSRGRDGNIQFSSGIGPESSFGDFSLDI